MMEALARRGFAVEVLCGPILELGGEIDLASALAEHGVSVEVRGGDTWEVGALGPRPATPDHSSVDRNGVPVTVLAGSTRPRTPDNQECLTFLWLFEQVWARFRPEVVVSYGGGSLTREILRRAKARGAATVFPLHNLRYPRPRHVRRCRRSARRLPVRRRALSEDARPSMHDPAQSRRPPKSPRGRSAARPMPSS